MFVEPLYKGQVGGGSFVPYTVEPLYKGQVGGGSFVLCPFIWNTNLSKSDSGSGQSASLSNCGHCQVSLSLVLTC